MRKHILSAILSLSLLTLSCGVACPELAAQQEMNNDSVIKMVKAGLSPVVIAASVNAQPGHYDLSADSLIALKKAGVSDQIVTAMIAHNSTPGAATATTTGTGSLVPAGAGGLPPGIDSLGVYYKDKDGNWTEVGAEVVNFKTGGALKHISSAGIVKGDLNGHVAGYHSRLELKGPSDFILYLPEGVSPGEYQLIRFRVSSDSREFRALTGGVAHTSGGAARDVADFSSKKLAPHIYSVTLSGDIGKGEYGFLPPQEASGGKNVSNSGKIYTFSFAD
jgi:hypothetical protein